MSAFILRTRLRKCRLDAGLSQVQVARYLGLKTPTSLARWEKGERLPSPQRSFELAAVYHRLVEDLYFPMYSQARNRIHRRRLILDRTANAK